MNQPLVLCSDCGKEISTRARACPQCGGPTPKALSIFQYVFYAVLSFIGVNLLLGIIVGAVFLGIGVVGEVSHRQAMERYEADRSQKQAAAAEAEKQNEAARLKQEEADREAVRQRDLAEQEANRKRDEEASRQQAEAKKQQALVARTNIFKFYNEKAITGDAYAQLAVGQKYLSGDGVEKDLDQARKWLKAAAASGQAEAAKLLTNSPEMASK
ncbi:MAG: hypothetical protein JWQ04_2829 [Pedosphaera sp.]|nr:hypothetical protein [Pedosphaera sp.]